MCSQWGLRWDWASTCESWLHHCNSKVNKGTRPAVGQRSWFPPQLDALISVCDVYSLCRCIVLYCNYLRDAMLARVIAIATCLSVCLSVTRRYCVKTKKASGMISSPSGSPKTLVFRRQISSSNSKGFPPNGSLKQGRSEKFSNFLALSVNISKTVADTAKVTISD